MKLVVSKLGVPIYVDMVKCKDCVHIAEFHQDTEETIPVTLWCCEAPNREGGEPTGGVVDRLALKECEQFEAKK